MLEIESKEIDGRTYHYQPLTLKPARTLFDKLLQRFGPAVADAVEGLKDAELNEDSDITEALGSIAGSAAGLLRGAVQGLDAKTHAELCDTVAKQTKVDMENEETGETQQMGLMAVRELIFGKSILTEFRVILFALQVQYEDFLAPMQNLAQTAMALRAKASSSNSQRGLTGSSTGSQPVSDTATA